MTDFILKARGATAGLLPVTHGTVTLSEAPAQPMTSVMPYPGQVAAVEAALQEAHGLSFPAPGQVTQAGDVRCLWTGQAEAWLVGVAPPDRLAGLAALSDQGDGWVVLHLTGQGAAEVLARRVPLDLRPARFGVQACARSLLGHAAIHLCRIEEGFEIRGFRSMARTLVRELADAMAAVAAREALH